MFAVCATILCSKVLLVRCFFEMIVYSCSNHVHK